MLASRIQKAVVYLLFFLSGSSGLIYEIIWSRKLTLIFGSTVYAVSTVLTVFFTGLALGAFLIGRAMDRGRDPVRSYVLLELLIGTFGICSPLIFQGIDWIYYHAQPLVASGLGGLTALRFVLSFLGLLIPTTLMGATLPVLVKLVVESDASVAPDAGRLYATNTLGAALGTLLAAIVLVPLMGVNASLYATGSLNLLIAASALLLFRGSERTPPLPRPSTSWSPSYSPTQKSVLALFAVVGFVSMVYQVAWIRLLVQVTGTTVYTFGLMLSVFIAGVGLGSGFATWLLPRTRSVILAFALVELVASAYALISVSFFDQLPLLFVQLAGNVTGFSGLLLVKLVINLIVLLVPTLMFGAAFPLVAAIFAEKAEDSAGDVGLVYSVNTIGGVVGSAAGGFLILPALGAQNTILAMGGLGLVISAVIALLQEEKARQVAVLATCGVVLLLGVGLYRPWNKILINSGPYQLRYPDVDALANLKHKLLYYREGVNVNVSVIGDVKPETIFINGKPMASIVFTDVANQYLLGHLPMLLHSNPRSSMVIGLGAGMTLGSLLVHGEPVDVVEISPEVVAGARMFSDFNRSALDQPNANLIFDDGRNYLKTTRRKYDVITEDPLDPFFAGSGYLYDLEHFQNAKKALNPGGLMCQYLPLYQVGTREARIIVKTFHEVFPHVTAWFAFNDMLLIGSEEPIQIDLANLRRRISRPEIARDLREIGIDNEYDFLANFLFDQDAIRESGVALPINTDDYPIIEYMTPRALGQRTMLENIEYFLGKRAPHLPPIVDLTKLSSAELDVFTRRMPIYFRAREHIIKAHLRVLKREGGILREIRLAEESSAPHPTASYYAAWIRMRRGNALRRNGEFEASLRILRSANRLRPDHPPILTALGLATHANGNDREALALLERSLELDDLQVEPRSELAAILLELGEIPRARQILERCLELKPAEPSCAIALAEIAKTIR
jgi:spermidine synthase